MGRAAYPHMKDVHEFSKRLEQALTRVSRSNVIEVLNFAYVVHYPHAMRSRYVFVATK